MRWQPCEGTRLRRPAHRVVSLIRWQEGGCGRRPSDQALAHVVGAGGAGESCLENAFRLVSEGAVFDCCAVFFPCFIAGVPLAAVVGSPTGGSD